MVSRQQADSVEEDELAYQIHLCEWEMDDGRRYYEENLVRVMATKDQQMKTLLVQFQKDQILSMPSFSQAPPAMVSLPMTKKVTHVDNIQYEKVDLLFDVEMIGNLKQQTQAKGVIHVDLFVEHPLIVDDD